MQRSRVTYARYVELIGITPAQFEIVVAVLAHERVHGIGVGCTRGQIVEILEARKLSGCAELIRNGWLASSGEAALSKQLLTATGRAWRNFWPSRLEDPEPLVELLRRRSA